MIKITIITVVYNNKSTISRAIESVLSQNYSNIEYIIIDGASTDGTIDIINTYKNRISKIISEKDKGIYDAMNKGIEIATGDVVGILNSDDSYIDENSVSEIAKTFENYNTDSVFADVIMVKEHDQNAIVRYYSAKKFKLWHFRFGHMPGHATFFAKRELFDKLGKYDTRYRISADFDLLLRFLFVHRISYKYIPKVLVKMSLGGISTQGFSSIKQMNLELKDSLKKNKVKSNIIMIYMKYFAKVFQFVLRPKS